MDNMITGCQTPLKMSFDVDEDFKNELIDALTWKEWNLQEVNQNSSCGDRVSVIQLNS